VDSMESTGCCWTRIAQFIGKDLVGVPVSAPFIRLFTRFQWMVSWLERYLHFILTKGNWNRRFGAFGFA
jgi:hypothetical protein